MKYSKIFSLLLATLAKCECTFPAVPPGKRGAKGKLEGGTVVVVSPR